MFTQVRLLSLALLIAVSTVACASPSDAEDGSSSSDTDRAEIVDAPVVPQANPVGSGGGTQAAFKVCVTQCTDWCTKTADGKTRICGTSCACIFQ